MRSKILFVKLKDITIYFFRVRSDVKLLVLKADFFLFSQLSYQRFEVMTLTVWPPNINHIFSNFEHSVWFFQQLLIVGTIFWFSIPGRNKQIRIWFWVNTIRVFVHTRAVPIFNKITRTNHVCETPTFNKIAGGVDLASKSLSKVFGV